MAKRMTSCRAWHWLRNVRTVGWTFTLMAGLCSGQILRAAESTPSSSPPTNAITALLAYQETDYSVVNWSVSLTTQTAPFKNEPVAAAGKTVRGVLRFGDNSSNAMAFVWQRGAGKLFLDLNRNQDLTDDSTGVFSVRGTKLGNFQSFAGVHLPLPTMAGNGQVLVDINFSDYSSRPNCSLAVRSFWQGRATLQGRDWQVGIVQNVLNQAGSFENGQLLLRPWEQRSQAFTAYGNAPDAFPFTRKVFVDGHAYQLEPITNAQNGASQLALRFTEQSVALGELKVTGKFIQRLVLPGGPYLVLLDQPAGTVKIPAGSYNQPNVRLEQNGTVANGNPSQTPSSRRFSVDDQTPAVLNVGGPLTNSVLVSRHGEDLRLDYRLAGVGGETYQMANENRSHPPEFAIYKGDKQIASGKFEFG